MHRQPLLTMLDRYAARYPAEGAVTARIRARRRPSRLLPAHLSPRARHGLGVGDDAPARDKFLLVHHRKLNRWLQPGGHMDGHGNVAAAAVREVQEETGLADVRLTDPLGAPFTPLDLDVHVIPARYDAAGTLVEDAHEHHDVRVLAIAHGDLTPTVSDESHAVRWFTAEELQAITDEESVLRLWRKSTGAKDRMTNDE